MKDACKSMLMIDQQLLNYGQILGCKTLTQLAMLHLFHIRVSRVIQIEALRLLLRTLLAHEFREQMHNMLLKGFHNQEVKLEQLLMEQKFTEEATQEKYITMMVQAKSKNNYLFTMVRHKVKL